MSEEGEPIGEEGEGINEEEPARRSPWGPMYSANQVSLATFLGSPVGGAWLLRSNYRAMNDGGAGRKALWFGVAATVFVFAVALFLPPEFPDTSLPIVYSLAMHLTHVRLQGDAYRAHMAGGGRQQSWLRALLVGIVSVVLLLAALYALDAVAGVVLFTLAV